MKIKKGVFVFLAVIMTAVPLATTGQSGSMMIDDQFTEDIMESWREAKTVWARVYNVTRPVWDQQIKWRVKPIWDGISMRFKSWVDNQIVKLKEAFRKDKEKVVETAKEEAEEAGKRISKSIWQVILEALGIR